MDYKIGDVFKIDRPDSWKEKDRQWHHTMECYGVIIESGSKVLLCDTYWGINRRDTYSKCWEIEDIGKDVVIIEYLGNLNNYNQTKEYDLDYYDDKDIMLITSQHACTKQFYLRKNAQKSTEKMKSVIKEKIEKNLRDIEYAENAIERLNEALERVEKGETERVYI